MMRVTKPIISLSTIPERIAHIEPCLDSLNRQGLDVHLWISRYCHRTGSQFDTLPDFVKRKCYVHCLATMDLGPAMKLIPSLLAGYERVITADDDRVYEDGWADNLLQASERLPETAIAYRGRRLTGKKTYSNSKEIMDVDEDMPVDILTGCLGAYYERDMFTDSFLVHYRFSGCRSDLANNDDLLFSDHLRTNEVPMVVPKDCPSAMVQEDKRIKEIKPLLENNNRRKMNDEYMKELFA